MPIDSFIVSLTGSIIVNASRRALPWATSPVRRLPTAMAAASSTC